MKKRAGDELKGNIDSQGAKPTPDFKGYMDPISKVVEERLWMFVNILADTALARYKTTM